MGAQHLPGEEVWLVGEHRSSGERKHYLFSLPADALLKRFASATPMGDPRRGSIGMRST